MSVNGISYTTEAYHNSSASTMSKKPTKDNVSVDKEPAAIYTSSNSSVTNNTKTYKQDTATIQQLKEDYEKRSKQLMDLIRKSLQKQGEVYHNSTNIYQLLREGKVKVDPETAAQARADIAEDGYWGVEQTSDRLVSFATAISGGDPSKADEMIKAVKKGFEAATKSWGDELPDICRKTYDSTIEKINKWKESLSNETA